MEDYLQDMLFICSLKMINFTLGSNHLNWGLPIWMASFECCQNYLTEFSFAVLILACIKRCCEKQLSKRHSCVHCWDKIQDVILWIQKHFLYEGKREKFFSGQHNENLKQLVCLYLMNNMDLLTENIFLFTLICRQLNLWPIFSVSIKSFVIHSWEIGKFTPELFSNPHYLFVPVFSMIDFPCILGELSLVYETR